MVPPLVAVVTAGIRVTSATTCPDADDVAARLRRLLPSSVDVAAGPPTAVADTLELTNDGDDLKATLKDASGASLGERRLPAAHACADLAAAVAIATATWESDVHPEFAVAAPAPVVATPAAPPPPASAWDATVGAGMLLAAANGGGSAWHAELGGGWRRRAGASGVRLRLDVQGLRTITLGNGEVGWRRWAAALGGDRRVLDRGEGGAWLAVEAAAVAALFALDGRGFDRNHSVRAFDPGGYAGLRAGWGTAPTTWVTAGVTAFAAARTATAEPNDARRGVPRWEVALTLGIAFDTVR